MTIFEHADYKAYMNARIAALPKRGRGETNRMAAHLGVHPSLVSQVLRGSKDFLPEQAHKLAAYLGLARLEADYFILLVQRERAGTAAFKQYFQAKLEEARAASVHVANRIDAHRKLSEKEQAVFYSSWIYPAIRLFASVGEGQTAEAIAERFRLPRATVMAALEFLVAAQLCDEDGGRYRMGSRRTHLEFGSPFLSRFHTLWRMRAIQRSEDLTAEELMFTSPFSVSRKDFPRIREELLAVIKSSSSIIRESDSEDVAVLNLDLFWMRF